MTCLIAVYPSLKDERYFDAAYQHDLNNAAAQKKRKAFISHQIYPFDEYEHDP